VGLKYKTSVFFSSKHLQNNIQDVCYTKVYKIVLNGGFLHEFIYADSDWDKKTSKIMRGGPFSS